MKFKEYSFKDLLVDIVDNRGKTCPTAETGIPLIATNCIKNDALYPVFEKVRYVDDETYNNWFRGHPEPGDMIFVCKGSPGRVAWVPDPINFCIAQDMVAIRADATKVYPKYLFALLRSEQTQQKILSMHVGTLIPHFKKGDFGNLYFDIPEDFEYQKQVGDAYFGFCEKIELNQQINQTLEQIAQAIFKSWFVDFEPVKAKIEAKQNGQDPERAVMRTISGKTDKQLDQLSEEQRQQLTATSALFPDQLEDSELGEIPKGWDVTNLKAMTVKIGSGATPRGGGKAYIDDGISLIRSQNVYDSAFKWDGLAHITDEAAEQLKGVTVEKNDVLFNITGASILRTCVVEPSVLPARVNQHVAIIRAAPNVCPRYIHLHMLRKRTKEYLIGMNAGGSREAVTKGHIESVPIINPGESVLNNFHNLVEPLYKKFELQVSESRCLSDCRDSLLPKLLSGEIAVEVESKIREIA